jgi:hypothetical protein
MVKPDWVRRLTLPLPFGGLVQVTLGRADFVSMVAGENPVQGKPGEPATFGGRWAEFPNPRTLDGNRGLLIHLLSFPAPSRKTGIAPEPVRGNARPNGHP